MAEPRGLEPLTSGVTGQHSNQLSYGTIRIGFAVWNSSKWLFSNVRTLATLHRKAPHWLPHLCYSLLEGVPRGGLTRNLPRYLDTLRIPASALGAQRGSRTLVTSLEGWGLAVKRLAHMKAVRAAFDALFEHRSTSDRRSRTIDLGESNPAHCVLQARLQSKYAFSAHTTLSVLEAPAGFDPATTGLTVRCSTN